MSKFLVPLLLFLFVATIARADVFTWSKQDDFDACAKDKTITDRNPTISKAWHNYDVALAASFPEFGPRKRLNIGGTPNGFAHQPRLYSMPDGTTRMYYTYYHGSYYDIQCRISMDGGNSWGNAIPLGLGYDSTHNALSPSLYIDENGTFRLYYCQNNGSVSDAGYSTSADGLSNWTGFVPLSLTIPGQNIWDFQVLRLADNSFGIYCNYEPERILRCSFSATGLSFPPLQTLNINSATAPFLWKLPNGTYRLYYVWYGAAPYSQLAYRESPDGRISATLRNSFRNRFRPGLCRSSVYISNAPRRNTALLWLVHRLSELGIGLSGHNL